MKNIAIFASGNGTNAEHIIKYFENSSTSQVKVVFTNNSKAGVINRAHELFVDVHIINRHELYDTNNVISLIEQYSIDLIVLAGFLWLVPESLINIFENRIINIHPALLPNYGGKGMYGMRVHEAVIAAGNSKSGITIHKVNKHYDEGQVIFQTDVDIDINETPHSLADKIHLLEHKHFPVVVDEFIINYL